MRVPSIVAVVLLGTLVSAVPRAQTSTFLPIDEIRPGMVGIGRTVFAGEQTEEFRANILGVLRNVMGPKSDLILARLEGGPLANTGVIAGMSGSPVYVNGRLIGAVSYQLGSFPKEPLAGITPIAEMTGAVEGAPGRTSSRDIGLTWPATSTEVFAAMNRVMRRAQAPVGSITSALGVVGPASLADLAPQLRPIGAAMVVSGFSPELTRGLQQALSGDGLTAQPQGAVNPRATTAALRGGDPVGMSLVRGDFQTGATGTVTYVDGTRVYAFGHPFLNLGSTQFAMTRAHVFTVLPSLDNSMKIASMGDVIGTMNQDRATAVGGTLGAGPRELEVNLTLNSDGSPERRFKFFVVHDPSLTALFTYVAVLNSLVAYERQTGTLSIGAKGRVSFGADGDVTIDDFFSGDTALTSAAAALAAPIGSAIANEFKKVMPERMDIELRASEQPQITTIERAWLDTTQPHFGSSHTLHVLLRDYRGATRDIAVPVTMPAHADGPLTLLVSDATALTDLEKRDIKPGRSTTWPALLAELNSTRRNNRLYVRLIAGSTGTVVAGDTLPALPAGVRSILDSDPTVARAPVAKTIVGAWEQRLDVAVRGSRELSITLTSRQ